MSSGQEAIQVNILTESHSVQSRVSMASKLGFEQFEASKMVAQLKKSKVSEPDPIYQALMQSAGVDFSDAIEPRQGACGPVALGMIVEPEHFPYNNYLRGVTDLELGESLQAQADALGLEIRVQVIVNEIAHNLADPSLYGAIQVSRSNKDVVHTVGIVPSHIQDGDGIPKNYWVGNTMKDEFEGKDGPQTTPAGTHPETLDYIIANLGSPSQIEGYITLHAEQDDEYKADWLTHAFNRAFE